MVCGISTVRENDTSEMKEYKFLCLFSVHFYARNIDCDAR